MLFCKKEKRMCEQRTDLKGRRNLWTQEFVQNLVRYSRSEWNRKDFKEPLIPACPEGQPLGGGLPRT